VLVPTLTVVKKLVAQVLKALAAKFVHNKYQLTSEVSVSRKTVPEESTLDSSPGKLSGKENVPQRPLNNEIGAR
jgi:hypothetical protein